MKKNNAMVMNRKNNGYELMGKGMSVNVMRTYWKGSPWNGLRACAHSVYFDLCRGWGDPKKARGAPEMPAPPGGFLYYAPKSAA